MIFGKFKILQSQVSHVRSVKDRGLMVFGKVNIYKSKRGMLG